APLRMLEIGARRAVERSRVCKAPAAHSRSAENENVLECCQPPDTLQAKLRCPEHAPHLPSVAWQVFVAKSAATFEDRHAVSFFGQPQRGHAATEAGADHDPVEVVFFSHGWSSARAHPRRPVETN